MFTNSKGHFTKVSFYWLLIRVMWFKCTHAMATMLMCHLQNFLLTTFKELRPNKINKVYIKKNGKMNTTPLFSNIWWNSARSWVRGVSWWYMYSEIVVSDVLQENQAEWECHKFTKAKGTRIHTGMSTHCGIVTPYGNLDLGHHLPN